MIYVPNTTSMISHCTSDNLVNKFASLYGIYCTHGLCESPIGGGGLFGGGVAKILFTQVVSFQFISFSRLDLKFQFAASFVTYIQRKHHVLLQHAKKKKHTHTKHYISNATQEKSS